MRCMALVIACWLLVLPAAQAAEKPPPLKWHGGDCGVLTWPGANFTLAERAKQATDGGLNWMVVCNGVRTGALADPDAGLRLKQLDAKNLTPILGLRWHNPRPISEDVICLGVDTELPLPRARAQEVIDWANALGGAAILADPGRKLERYATTLNAFAAFEAFHDGRWNPECLQGGAWDKLLASGRRLFIVGGTSEGTRPVLGRGAVVTYVLSKSNSVADIVAGIRMGRVVVSERDVMRLNFTVNGKPPGSVVVPKDGRVEIVIDLVAREDVDEIKIVGNTTSYQNDILENRITAVYRARVDGKKKAEAFTLRLPKGVRYLRAVGVIYKGACQTMTNPIFIGPGAPKPMPLDVSQEHFRLVSRAIKSLDWSDPAATTAVVDKLLDGQVVGLYAAMALGRSLGKEQLDRIRPLLESERPRVRALAAYILVQVEGAAALPSVLSMLKDRESMPRIYATRVLAKFARPKDLDLALRAARDPWPGVRQYGLVALARIPSRESLVQLREALLERIPAVRQTAETQLSLMLGVERAHQEQFIKAFARGRLGRRLIEAAVTRAELRPLVEEVASKKPAGATEPGGGEPGGEGPTRPAARSLTAAQAAEPPKIDGSAGDKAWVAALAGANFLLADGKPAGQQTSVRALYDKNALYLLFECAEPNLKQIVANEKVYDGNIWLDDSVDIYLCPEGAREDANPRYYRFCVNSSGVRFDEDRRRRHWNVAWRAAGSVGKEDGWTIEVALPFSSLGVKTPESGKTKWLVNFVRHRRVKPEEESSFTAGDFRTPANYADLTFE